MNCQVCGAALDFSMWDNEACENAAYCCEHWYHGSPAGPGEGPSSGSVYVFSGPETRELQQRIERKRALIAAREEP